MNRVKDEHGGRVMKVERGAPSQNDDENREDDARDADADADDEVGWGVPMNVANDFCIARDKKSITRNQKKI